MAECEKQLEEQLNDYIEIAKSDKKVDVAGLAMGALQNMAENRVSSKMRKWAYWISFLFPPFGLIFSIKYYFFSDKSDARRVANMCLIITALTIGLFLLFMWTMFASVGTENLKQIEQINPQDVQDLLQ
jgi:hypothetical protein